MANDPRRRLDDRIRDWNVSVEEIHETKGSLIAFGHRGLSSVVLKLIKRPGEERRSGEVLEAFGAKGTVGVYDHGGGALLLEPLFPGNPLSELVPAGCDDEASEILAEVVKVTSPAEPPRGCPSVETWGAAFERYRRSGDRQIPADLVEQAHVLYMRFEHLAGRRAFGALIALI